MTPNMTSGPINLNPSVPTSSTPTSTPQSNRTVATPPQPSRFQRFVTRIFQKAPVVIPTSAAPIPASISLGRRYAQLTERQAASKLRKFLSVANMSVDKLLAIIDKLDKGEFWDVELVQTSTCRAEIMFSDKAGLSIRYGRTAFCVTPDIVRDLPTILQRNKTPVLGLRDDVPNVLNGVITSFLPIEELSKAGRTNCGFSDSLYNKESLQLFRNGAITSFLSIEELSKAVRTNRGFSDSLYNEESVQFF